MLNCANRAVKSVPPLNSADLPHGIVSIGGRSVELNRVTELTEGLCSHIVECCRPSVISGTWLNSQTFRSNAAIIPLVSGITDWLAEPFIPLLVTAIVLRDCFVIDADHPEPRKGLRSLARSGGQQGGGATRESEQGGFQQWQAGWLCSVSCRDGTSY